SVGVARAGLPRTDGIERLVGRDAPDEPETGGHERNGTQRPPRLRRLVLVGGRQRWRRHPDPQKPAGEVPLVTVAEQTEGRLAVAIQHRCKSARKGEHGAWVEVIGEARHSWERRNTEGR